MTLSAVEICNLALADVPAKRIVSLEDTSISAEACRREFTQAVEELMEMGEWGFATRRALLVQTPSTRLGYFNTAFAAPNDLAFPIRVVPADGEIMRGRSLDFDFEGGVIFTNGGAAALEYISKTPSFASMTAMFRRGLATVLASRVVMDITRDAGRKRELLQEAEVWRDRALARSLNMNSQQQTYGENFIPSSLKGHFEGGVGYGGGGSAPMTALPDYGGEGYDFVAYVDSLFN